MKPSDNEKKERFEKYSHIIGTKIKDRYELKKIIGFGGMSAVYHANDNVLLRDVAIKIFLMSDMNLGLRFRQEATLVSHLKHPNCVTIYDFGVHEEKYLYMIMELLEGETLKIILQKEKVLSPFRAIPIIMQVLDALDFAHSKSIIHRDIKPSNIIISQDKKGKDVVKIFDFGIAKVIEGVLKPSSDITVEEKFIGTPKYMSPEQLLAKTLTYKTDIFSAGVTLFQTLTGKYPFNGDHPYEILKQQESIKPKLPSVSPLGFIYPEKLNLVVQKALEFDPEKRYARASDFQEELHNVFKELPPEIEKVDSKVLLDELKAPVASESSEVVDGYEVKKKRILRNILFPLGAMLIGLIAVFFVFKTIKKEIVESKKQKVPVIAPLSNKESIKSKKEIIKSKMVTIKLSTIPQKLQTFDNKGEYLGETPLILKYDLSKIPSFFVFKKGELSSEEIKANINGEKEIYNLEFNLMEIFSPRILKINTIPSNLEIFDENNLFVGISPGTIPFSKNKLPALLKFKKGNKVTDSFKFSFNSGEYFKEETLDLTLFFNPTVQKYREKKVIKSAKEKLKIESVEDEIPSIPSVEDKEEPVRPVD